MKYVPLVNPTPPELSNRTVADGGGNTATDVGTDVTGSSGCFVQALGGWVAALVAALAAIGVGRRQEEPATPCGNREGRA